MRVYLASGGDAHRAAVADAGHELLPAPPMAHAGVAASEREHFLRALDAMMEADVLVADVSEPDAGVGWCVAWALARGRLVVLACGRDARARLAPMVAGNPSPWQRLVLYEREDDLRAALRQALSA